MEKTRPFMLYVMTRQGSGGTPHGGCSPTLLSDRQIDKHRSRYMSPPIGELSPHCTTEPKFI
ncbi:hypothetical protein J6590_056497 [Homalodisca vitripennis]|nr:hypothetical protein J6590_056497 [Homalodisca vitripennis]